MKYASSMRYVSWNQDLCLFLAYFEPKQQPLKKHPEKVINEKIIEFLKYIQNLRLFS